VAGTDERVRIAFARDRHPFGPGEPLALGGTSVPGPRLFGHSDGDVVLHAVGGALLAAAGLDDFGSMFPADARTERGIASERLIAAVVDRLSAEGFRPVAVDVSLEGARPRLNAHLPTMRTAVARLLGLTEAAVGIKASSGNLGADTGAGRAIEATALATIAPIDAGEVTRDRSAARAFSPRDADASGLAVGFADP
jgi:2-C-methyl-D-erythritol 2,4-cyclodiphosphate synthase